MKAASSEARKASVPVRSSGVSVRLMACCSRIISNQPNSPGLSLTVVSVRVSPGAMVLTVIPKSPTSDASDRANPIKPPLLFHCGQEGFHQQKDGVEIDG